MTPEELAELGRKAEAGLLELSDHANMRMAARHITTTELRQVLLKAEVIETYPADRYWPSCLIFGKTAFGRPLHVVCTYPDRPLLKIITVYEPSLAEWLADFKTRKPI